MKLERLSTNALLPSLQRLKIEEDLVRLLDHTGKPAETSRVSKTDRAQAMDETKRSEYEELVIGWQQKLFSRVSDGEIVFDSDCNHLIFISANGKIMGK